MNDRHTLPRLVEPALTERLRVMPAVVVTGARQTGKSTLAAQGVPGPRRYASLDDLDVLDAARLDPEAPVGGRGAVTFDEVRREPGLLAAVKRAIDRDRRPGRFLLTRSANLLLMRQVSESLAGRASYLKLWPMTRGEQRGERRAGRWEELLAAADEDWADLLAPGKMEAEDWRAPGTPRRLPDTGARACRRPGARHLVRRLRADLPAARPPGPGRDQCAAGLPAPHAGGLPAPGPARQPDGAGARRVAPAGDRAPLAQPARDVLPAGAPSRLCREPHQTADQDAISWPGGTRGSRARR